MMKKYILTAIVTVAVVVLSTIPIVEHPPLEDVPLIDKWVHMVMYGGLAFVMWVDHVVRGKQPFGKGFRWLMFLYPTLLGGALELVQAYLTTYRSGDWIDFEADAIGALLATLLCLYLNRFTPLADEEKTNKNR